MCEVRRFDISILRPASDNDNEKVIVEDLRVEHNERSVTNIILGCVETFDSRRYDNENDQVKLTQYFNKKKRNSVCTIRVKCSVIEREL